MNFDSTQKELFKYISEHKIFRIFIPISSVLLILGEILFLASNFGIRLGIFNSIITILVYVCIVVTLSKGDYNMLMIGLALRSVDYIIKFVQSCADPYSTFNLGAILYAVIWAYFAYLAYRKTLKL